MSRPVKYNLDGISPIRGHEFFEKQAHNKAIDLYDAYLKELGIELPEEEVSNRQVIPVVEGVEDEKEIIDGKAEEPVVEDFEEPEDEQIDTSEETEVDLEEGQ